MLTEGQEHHSALLWLSTERTRSVIKTRIEEPPDLGCVLFLPLCLSLCCTMSCGGLSVQGPTAKHVVCMEGMLARS